MPEDYCLELLERLAPVLETAEGNERVAAPFIFPVLLEADVQERLASAIRRVKRPAHDLRGALAVLEETSAQLKRGEIPWSYGLGPIEVFCHRCEAGESTWATAREALTSPRIQRVLTSRYLQRFARFLANCLHRGEWQRMTPWIRLLREVVEAGEWTEAARRVEMVWLEYVQFTLCEVSDGRLYREGVRAGDALVAAAEAEGDSLFLSAAAYRAGVMSLDPYSSGLTGADAAVELKRRQQRFIDAMGPALAGLPEEEWKMPPPAEALCRSAALLDRALVCEPGYERGLTLKARAQVCEWRGVFGDHSDEPRIRALCEEALPLLDAARWPEQVAAVRAMLHRASAGQSVPDSAAPPIEDWRAFFDERRGTGKSLHVLFEILDRLAVLFQTDIEAAWLAAQKILPIFDEHGAEQQRRSLFSSTLTILFQLASQRRLTIDPTPDATATIAAWRARAESARWTPEDRALAALAIFPGIQRQNGEAEYLQFLSPIFSAAPDFVARLGSLHDYLRLILHQGAGANAWNVGDAAAAAERYGIALGAALQLEFRDGALDLLDYLRDAAPATGEKIEVGYMLIAILGQYGMRLEGALGTPATRIIQQICRMVLAAFTGQQVKIVALLLVAQVAKGMRFGAALASLPEVLSAATNTPELARRGNRVAALRQEVAALPPTDDPPPAVSNEMLLGAYLEPAEELTDDDPRSRLVHASRQFDALLFQHTAEAAGAVPPEPLSDEALQACLDDRTVLIDLQLGHTIQGAAAVFALAFTREESAGCVTQLPAPSGTVTLSDGDLSATTTMVGFLVGSLREKLLREPLGLHADPEALSLLEEFVRICFGHLPEQLARWRQQGKDHLCLVPHGALHYLPFSLLGPAGKPLADDWIVTTLPNLQLLRRAAESTREAGLLNLCGGMVQFEASPETLRRMTGRTLTLASLGLAFPPGNPHDLPAIPEAETEATALASIFGTEAVLGSRATEAAFHAALHSARYVHLATHGLHDVAAPAFQALFLQPDDTSDGRVEAREIQRLDLRGLEIVSLSACESALGRFDLGDNLRGLPASFFLAGVQTFIGALWPCESAASACFFTSLYRALHEGRSRRDAFAAAQRETREQFPKYRDWGAFYFAGAWS